MTTPPRGSSVPFGANAVAWMGLGPAVAGSTKDCNETPSGNEVVAVTGAPGIATVDVDPSEFVSKVIGTSTVLAPDRIRAVTLQVPITETAVPCPTQAPSIPWASGAWEPMSWWSIGWASRICETGRSGRVTDRNRRV